MKLCHATQLHMLALETVTKKIVKQRNCVACDTISTFFGNPNKYKLN